MFPRSKRLNLLCLRVVVDPQIAPDRDIQYSGLRANSVDRTNSRGNLSKDPCSSSSINSKDVKMQHSEPEGALHTTKGVEPIDRGIKNRQAPMDGFLPSGNTELECPSRKEDAVDNRTALSNGAGILVDNDLEVHWDGNNDPENPRNFKLFRKWVIVAIVSLSCLCV
jgi:hypothetical protein